MNLFIESHQELLQRLIESNIEFIVVGGYSVIFHGYKRTTADVDIWLKPDNSNRDKLIPILYDMDFEPSTIRSLAELDFKQHLVFTIGEEPERIDFITIINAVDYSEADARKIIADIDGLTIPFLHLNDLILSKFSTGRLKDKADIEELQKIKERQNKK